MFSSSLMKKMKHTVASIAKNSTEVLLKNRIK